MEILPFLGTAFSSPHLGKLVWAIFGTVLKALVGAARTWAVRAAWPCCSFRVHAQSGPDVGLSVPCGGTITAVLLHIPGRSDAIWTALEGHKLAHLGQYRRSSDRAATVSFFAGTVSLILLSLAPMLAPWAVSFGPAEHSACC